MKVTAPAIAGQAKARRERWEEAERASEARHGGRLIRQTLAAGYTPHGALVRAHARAYARSGASPDLWRPRDTATTPPKGPKP